MALARALAGARVDGLLDGQCLGRATRFGLPAQLRRAYSTLHGAQRFQTDGLPAERTHQGCKSTMDPHVWLLCAPSMPQTGCTAPSDRRSLRATPPPWAGGISSSGKGDNYPDTGDTSGGPENHPPRHCPDRAMVEPGPQHPRTAVGPPPRRTHVQKLASLTPTIDRPQAADALPLLWATQHGRSFTRMRASPEDTSQEKR